MRGILHSITRTPEAHTFEVSIAIGNTPPQTDRVSCEHHAASGNLSAATIWNTGELLSRLTKLGDRGLVPNWFYELEMIHLLQAFDRGEPMPQLPVELGTTRFWKPPGTLRVLQTRIMQFFWRRGLLPKRFSSIKIGRTHTL